MQLEKLKAAGCTKIFEEKKSGASKRQRENLSAALNYVREGDELVITRLDRLARSVLDLSNIAEQLKSHNVELIVLDQAIDTTNPTGKLMFHVLSAIGEFERELINERVREGIAKAKRSGIQLGRKKKLSKAQITQLKAEVKNLACDSKSAIAEKY